MKKTFTFICLFFVFAFFLSPVIAQQKVPLPVEQSSLGVATVNANPFNNQGNTSSAANPLSRAWCYNGAGPFQLNSQSLANTTLTPVGATVAFGFPGAAAWNYSNGKLYVIDQAAPFALYTVDTLTGVRTFVANCTGVPQNNFTGITWDPTTGNMYGVSSTIAVSQIFTVNVTTGVCTPIGAPTAVVPAAIMVNASPTGVLYSVDIVGDNLYSWNKTTGVPTLIGPIGFNSNFGQDAHFDFSDGQYYWAAYNSTAGTGQLRILNTATGGSTLVGAYAGQVATLGIYSPLLPIQATSSAITAESCVPANGRIDPNETVTVSFCLQNTGTANTTNLVGTLLPTGGVAGPSAPQSYGVVVAGGAPVCRSFTFTGSVTCGATVTATIQLQDGAVNIGTISYNFATGTLTAFFTQNFDAVVAPALPAGWVATNAAGPAPLWVTSNTASVSAPNSIFINDPNVVSDKIIETPTIAIASAGSILSFRNNYNLENNFDGGVLEISINGAAYQDFITAGGTFTGGGYNGTVSTCCSNPLGGRPAWTGNAGSFLTTTATLPAAATGQNIKLRFRMGSDNSVAGTGWRIDDFAISNFVCCVGACVTPVATPVANQVVCRGLQTAPVNFTSTPPGAIFTWTNNNPAIGLPASGTGNIAAFTAQNPGLTPITATITATPTAGTCVGLPISFTITVNPNPDVVIVADPGTTICEGDPTLLTVVTGTSTPLGTLYTQGTGTPADGSPSQVFEPANAAFSSQGADDFIVPVGATWSVTQITTSGINTGAGNPTSVNVFFYTNTAGNLPGTAIASYNNVASFVRTGANYVVTLPAALNLTGGTYWVSFQVNMPFVGQGQWFWGNFGATNINSQYAWQNPGGGFATPCTSWGYGSTGCGVGGGVNRNNYFSIIGTSVVGGGPLPGGYTFLWSPAAGLSSTTSNPVAASPMNTTTYTVNVTSPAGCTRQASVLITVNKRPVVTTQPVSRTNCSGTSATFTVAGTGTNLTYQWQVSPTGCAGPWSNLVDGVPYSGTTTSTLTINPVSVLQSGYAYRVILSGVCSPVNNANISNCAVLTVNPLPNVAITPAGPVCGGVAGLFGTQLSVGSAPPPVPGAVTVNSGTINLAVPDNTANGVSNNLTIAGVPANATITNVSIALNMPHTYPADMVFNLRGPSGQILNLYKHHGNTDNGAASIPTAGFYNAVVNATSSVTFVSVPNPYRYGQTAPAGPYRPDALNGVTNPGYTIMDPAGFVSNASNFSNLYTTPVSSNGVWTLAMCDGGPGDIGSLVSWSITIDYTTPGTGGGPVLTYLWSPVAGLYTDAQAIIPYAGSNTPTVYAAPTALTVYTVTATNAATSCFSSASVVVNYTPPAPTVIPNPVTMCLGDAAVKLKSSSSQSFSATFNSGTLALAIPDGPATWPQTVFPGVSTPNLAVSGIPAGAIISGMSVKLNLTHTYIADMVIVLKAPNGDVLNLDAVVTRTGGAGANFVNTVISSAGTAFLSSSVPPYTGTFAPDAAGTTFVAAGFTFPGGPTTPAGYIPTVSAFSGLYSIPNGNYTLGMYDWGAGDLGVLTNWELTINYVLGVPATPATWSPAAGLFSDSAATVPYVAGTAVDSVWAKPTTIGANTYQVTVQSLPAFLPTPVSFTNPANITINASGPASPYPSNLTVSGLPTTGVAVNSVVLTGMSHTWGNDIDILLQSPTGTNVVLMSDVGGTVAVPNATYTFRDGSPAMNLNAANPTGTYSPTNNGAADNWPAPGPGAITQATPTLSMFGNTADMNGAWKLFVFDDVGGDQGNISGGYTIRFNVPVAPCTSPPRIVVVTVNQTASVTTQPTARTICAGGVATFTVVAAGSGPFSYQWQVSTNGNNPPWTNVTNGGVYSGATTATLTITGAPASFNGNYYRVIINGAAPCGSATSNGALLTVNPTPIIVITANRTSLLPGQTATITSNVTPNAATTYSWLRNGVILTSTSQGIVSGIGTGTLTVDVDGMGTYQLRVNDVNTCSGISNSIVIKDSASGKCFIYPNPSSGQFEVRFYSVANNVNIPRTLTVFDAKGDRVLTQTYSIGRPYDRMPVDLRAHGKGIYWVEIGDRNGNRLTMCRVVIQ